MKESFEAESVEIPLESPEPAAPGQARPRFLAQAAGVLSHVNWGKIGLFIVSLILFILAITLMKDGSRGLAPLVRDLFSVTNPANSLGFGWLFAYAVMSGSPVAAAALTFFDAGVIDAIGTFTMITGSRLGASFIVLFVGLIYVLRGRNWANSLGIGLLSLTVTGSTYLISLAIGVFLLSSGVLAPFQLQSGVLLGSIIDRTFGAVAGFIAQLIPGWGIFLVGLGIIVVSFNLFDRCLPEMTLKESQVGRIAVFVYRPWVMFLLGSLVTLISLSVSVSLALLVPLSDRGFVRRENVIPYIMGANITTFIDTLFATLLLDNPESFTIVLASMISITIVSMVILFAIYHRYERAMLAFVSWVTANNRHLYSFLAAIVVIPVLLMFI